MAIDYSVLPLAKPEPRKRTKRRAQREHADVVAEIRCYVFGRERDVCRICRIRRAESMHELVPRSLGGKVSKRNSIAVCGSGTTKCHGFAQNHQVKWSDVDKMGAQGPLLFTPVSRQAAEWLRVKVGEQIESLPMGAYED